MPTCNRCTRRLARSWDEWFCWDHGTIYTPARAWDPVGDWVVAAREARSRGHEIKIPGPPVTQAEREGWRK